MLGAVTDFMLLNNVQLGLNCLNNLLDYLRLEKKMIAGAVICALKFNVTIVVYILVYQ